MAINAYNAQSLDILNGSINPMPQVSPPSFSDFQLDKKLLAALPTLGFDSPTPVQQQAIPAALANHDLLVSAETGSGKTLAFLLPCLQQLLASPTTLFGTKALILTPTRELAQQIAGQCQPFSQCCGLVSALVTGGEDFKRQQSAIRRNADIIIATPGRLLELLRAEAGDLSHLKMLVLDEADRMLDMGFSEDVLAIIETCKSNRQTLLFSATLSHAGVLKMAGQVLNDYQTLALNNLQEAHGNIDQEMILADGLDHKLKLLAGLLAQENTDKALVFTNTRDKAIDLQKPLQLQGFRVGLLHGELDQSERKRVMSLFHSGTINVLVSTDLAARGLDITGIGLVINFDVPRSAVIYIHRIGRTGRLDKKGKAITLVTSTDWNLAASIQRYLRHNFKLRHLDGLPGRFQGPKKIKSSGKAVSSKKKTVAEKKKPAEKIKIRHRDQKNIGKRRRPTGQGAGEE